MTEATATGTWEVTPDAPVTETFPEAFQAYWIRFNSTTTTTTTTASAQLLYR